MVTLGLVSQTFGVTLVLCHFGYTFIKVKDYQILVDSDSGQFICYSCNIRYFRTHHSLFQHCRTAAVHRGEWCE